MNIDIIIQDEGIITPFNIQSSRETRFTILPQTRDAVDEKEAADGDIDFGTWLGMGEFNLHGIIEFDSIEERNAAGNLLRQQLNDCRKPKTIAYECTPNRYNIIQLTGRPEITRFPCHLEIRAQFKAYPFWFGTEEKSLTGGGTIENEGTFETPLTIEISGPATNPSVVIGSSTLAYNGNIPAGQKLVIVTQEGNAGTVKLGNTNALGDYNGVFPMLPPGTLNVTAGDNVTIKWRDCWL